MLMLLDSEGGSRVKPETIGTHGLINYSAHQLETAHERSRREIFWRSLGKKIRKASFIK